MSKPDHHPVTAYIALGSNLGDRRATLDRAIEVLNETDGVEVVRVSSYHETAPVGGPPGQGTYLNGAAEIQTRLAPDALLQTLLDIEKSLGRVRGERFGPRTIDLDVLLYGNLILDEPGLAVPHPRMHERRFVLAPLLEIAGGVVHPVLKATIGELLLRLDPVQEEKVKVVKRELEGERALVTGSTSGIGRAIALELAAAGADVIVHGRREAAAGEVVALIRERGGHARVVLGDLRTLEGCRALVDEAWQQGGPLEIWVNNAGADTLTGEAARWPFEQKLAELLAIDLTATMLLSRDVGERMQANGRGVILTIGWDQAETGMEGDSGQLFAATKGAVMAFTKSLALSLAPTVRVNCLAPGWVRTAWGETASSVWQERVLRETPLKRWGSPEDVASAARWLASDAAAFMTGQVVRVNGGAVR